MSTMGQLFGMVSKATKEFEQAGIAHGKAFAEAIRWVADSEAGMSEKQLRGAWDALVNPPRLSLLMDEE